MALVEDRQHIRAACAGRRHGGTWHTGDLLARRIVIARIELMTRGAVQLHRRRFRRALRISSSVARYPDVSILKRLAVRDEANAVAHVQPVIEFEPAGIQRLIDSLPWLRARAVNRKLGMMRKVEARHGVLVNRHSGAKTDVGLIRKIAVTRHTGGVR